MGGFAAQAVVIGVWGRAALLAALFVVALRVPTALVGDRLAPTTAVRTS